MRRPSAHAVPRRALGVLGILVLSGLGAALTATPAAACGGLVGENGTIRLTRTSTLAAHHDGIERYVTSFQFSGQGAQVGSIVPLPGIPTKVERGGDWTLQRLQREVTPVARAFDAAAATAAGESSKAQVILQTKIDALDITILKGGGTEVGQWAVDHGFLLTPDAPEMLDFYSRRSPVFMAARFDATRAATVGQINGDGTPIMLTIPTDEPWVPLRILALGLGKAQVVNADVFLLTDTRPTLRAGGTGLTLSRSEPANKSLLDDLRSDTGMGWLPRAMWLSYLRVDTPASNLDFDLAVSTHKGVVPSALAAGYGLPGGPGLGSAAWTDSAPWWAPTGAVVLTALLALLVVRHVRPNASAVTAAS